MYGVGMRQGDELRQEPATDQGFLAVKAGPVLT